MRVKLKKSVPVLLSLVLVAMVAVGCSSFIWAQSATTGALAGTVNNNEDQPVAGVIVTLTKTGPRHTQRNTTGGNVLDGFNLIPLNPYLVDFTSKGFKAHRAI